MELDAHISLSMKNKKKFEIFPSFFAPALNALYPLHTNKGFKKPQLATWRDEACVEFQRGPIRVLVQYQWPNFVEVRVRHEGQPRNADFVLYEKFQDIHTDNATLLAQPLYEYLLSVSEQIYEKIVVP
jgi:hypothetical protein